MLSVGAKLAIAAGAAGLGYWLLFAGSGASGTGDAAAATAAGTKAGCDLGTKDAKAGNPEDLNPVDDSVRGLASKFGSAAPQYISAFEAAYSSCFAKNAPPPPVTKVDVPGPTKPPPPVAKSYLDRFTALDSWLAGSRQGAEDGYIHHIKTIDNYDPNTNGAKVPSAYRAGYKCGFYNAAKKAEAFDGMGSILTPDILPKDTENTVVSECSGQFGAWYEAHKSDASVAGVAGVAAVGSLRVGNLALVGARRAPVEIDRLHADMGRHFSPKASSRHGWPAPPDEIDDETSTLYRSF